MCVKAGWERGARARRPCCISVCSLFGLRLHGDGSSCSILGLGLAERGCPPACLSARPPAQPWELPALRPPAAHRPCQAGRKKACLLTPSTRLPGLRGSAQKMSGRGHREVGLEPGCLQPRENAPWPAAALARQRPGEGSRPHGRASGTQRGPSKALSEVSYPAYSAFPETPDHSWLGCPLLPKSFAEGWVSLPQDNSAFRSLVTAFTHGAINDQSSHGHQELKVTSEMSSPVVPMSRWRK